MAEEKLVHPIVTARTLPRGDREGNKYTHTQTHTKRHMQIYTKKENLQIHILILSFFYLNTDVFIPVSVTLSKKARLDFFSFLCTVKLCLLLGGGGGANA